MRAAIYVRVSTEEQARNGVSLAAQQRLARDRCVTEGWEISQVYIDDGYSGSNLDRPAMQRLIADARAGHFDVVVAYHLDRLSRRVQHALKLIEDDFIANGISVVLLQQPLDLSAATGRASLGFMSVVAQLEREMITERSRTGKKEAARSGRWRGGPRPFGYEYDSATKRLTQVPSEAETVRYMVHRYLEDGWGCTKIAFHLDAEGRSTAKGGLWSRVQVLQTLKAPHLCGLQQYEGEFYPIPVDEPIISRELWDRVQVEVQRRSRVHTHPKMYKYLLTGIARCGVCGSTIRGMRRFNPSGTEVAYYCCQNRMDWDRRRRHLCHMGYVRQKGVDEQVVARLRELSHSLDEDKMLEALDVDEEVEERTQRLRQLEGSLRQLRVSKNRLLDAYLADRVDKETYVERDDRLAEQISAMEKEIQTLERKAPDQRKHARKRLVARLLKDFDVMWAAMTKEEQVDLVHKVVESAVIHPGGVLEMTVI